MHMRNAQLDGCANINGSCWGKAGRRIDVSAAGAGSLPESLKPPWKTWNDAFVFSEERWVSGTLGVTKGYVPCSPAHYAIVPVPSEWGF